MRAVPLERAAAAHRHEHFGERSAHRCGALVVPLAALSAGLVTDEAMPDRAALLTADVVEVIAFERSL